METTTQTKWTAQGLGPRQAKLFNQAISKFNWEAKTIIEITEHGRNRVTPMFTGAINPAAAALLAEIHAKYNGTVTGSDYLNIVGDIQAATVKLDETRILVDNRATAEERAERTRIIQERDAESAAEAAHVATLQHHRYDAGYEDRCAEACGL